MKNRIISFGFLLAYCFLLIEILVLKELPLIRVGHMMFNFGGTQEGQSNFIPLKTIIPYLKGRNGLLIAGINIVGNIVALIPLGFIIPFVIPKMNWKKTILLGLLAGLLIEITQAILHIGTFDIDDVILNGLGVVIGFRLFRWYSKFSEKTIQIVNRSVIIVVILIITILSLSYSKIIQLPFGLESNIESKKLIPVDHNSIDKLGAGQCCDLCKGTGGTGQIVSIETNSIHIVRRDGTNQIVKLTKKTVIKTNKGDATNDVFKIGMHVTVIIDDTETALLILVCSTN